MVITSSISALQHIGRLTFRPDSPSASRAHRAHSGSSERIAVVGALRFWWESEDRWSDETGNGQSKRLPSSEMMSVEAQGEQRRPQRSAGEWWQLVDQWTVSMSHCEDEYTRSSPQNNIRNISHFRPITFSRWCAVF